jgi:putative flippase GtrA
MRRSLCEFFAYALVSGIALGFDFATLYFLVEAAGLHYLLAATCSFAAGAIVAYFLSTRLVFRYRRLRERRVEFMIFTGIGLVGLSVNGMAMYVLVGLLGIQYLAAKCAAAIFTFGVNFMVRRWALFSEPGVSQLPSQCVHEECQ